MTSKRLTYLSTMRATYWREKQAPLSTLIVVVSSLLGMLYSLQACAVGNRNSWLMIHDTLRAFLYQWLAGEGTDERYTISHHGYLTLVDCGPCRLEESGVEDGFCITSSLWFSGLRSADRGLRQSLWRQYIIHSLYIFRLSHGVEATALRDKKL